MSQDNIMVRRSSFLNGRNSNDDILKLLDSLEELAEQKTLSWFGRYWGLNIEEFHMLTNKIRASLPEEVRRARSVTSDSDRIVSAAKEEAEMIVEKAIEESNRIVDEARQMASRLIDTSEINRLAKAQAQEIMASAEASARDTRRGADEYAREVLASIENHLARVMGTLQKGREKLEVRINAQQPSDPVLPAGRGVRR